MARRIVAAASSALLVFGAAFAAAPGATMASVVITHAPRVALMPPTTHPGHNGHGGGGGGGSSPAFGWAASNWSGYAITGGPYTSITGSWTVPAVSRSRKPTYSSSWVGIDGFNNSDLIQTGTEQDYYNGSAHYSAWWEILPAAETVINDPVSPGDIMQASITEKSAGQWVISLTDQTEGWTATENESYSGPGTSAEWIQEAPTVGGRIATLANYGEATFDPGTANGLNPGLVVADGGVMIQNGVQVSTPSLPDSDTDGFNIQYGSTSPSASPS